MKSQIYHAPLGEGINRAWVTLEKLTDDGDVGAEHIVKATLFLLSLAAVTACLLIVFNPA